MSGNPCAATLTALPMPELKLGQISDAVAGSIDVIFCLEELTFLPYFVGSLPFESADKETSYKTLSVQIGPRCLASHSMYIAR